METALVSLICIALVIFGGMTMSHGFMSSVDASTAGLEQVGSRNEVFLRTELKPVSAAVTPSDNASRLAVVLENSGQTKMADFNKWDVIVQYYDAAGQYHVTWLPYAASGGDVNDWGVGWIRLNGNPEVYEPGVLNPGEQIMLDVDLVPAVGPGTTNMVVVSTPSGITSTAYFTP